MEALSSKLSRFGGTESTAALLRAPIPLQPLSGVHVEFPGLFPLSLPLPCHGNHFTAHKGQFSPCPAACGTGADVPISLRAEVLFSPWPCPSSENPDSLSALPLGVPRSPFPLPRSLDQQH